MNPDTFPIVKIVIFLGFIGIIYLIVRNIRRFEKTKTQLQASRDQLKLQGYTLGQQYTVGNYKQLIAYDLKKKIFFLVHANKQAELIAFSKIADCTLMVDDVEQKNFRVSANDTRQMSDDEFRARITDFILRHKGACSTIKLKVEYGGFSQNSFQTLFYKSLHQNKEKKPNSVTFMQAIIDDIIQWFKIVRKIIEMNSEQDNSK